MESFLENMVFPIMIYSNQTAGETLEFWYYESSSSLYVQLSETYEFISDMTEGNAVDPFIFTITSDNLAACTDIDACNYSEIATINDGSCAQLDCLGVCGGIDTSCLSMDKHITESFSINNIYPNPFNPVVNIGLSIDIAGPLQLSVFNIEGIQIKTVYNGPSSAGESIFIWRPENTASGFYFISAVIDDQVKTQKVLFLK